MDKIELMDKEDEFNDFMKNYFFNHQQHHNAWSTYDFEPYIPRGKRHSSMFDNADYVYEHKRPTKSEGTITILSTPPKVRPEAYASKSRRFRKDLKVNAIGTSMEGYKEVLVLKVNDEDVVIPERIINRIKEGVYIVPNIHIFRTRRIRHNSKSLSLTHLLYLCIVESQYIEFEEV